MNGAGTKTRESIETLHKQEFSKIFRYCYTVDVCPYLSLSASTAQILML